MNFYFEIIVQEPFEETPDEKIRIYGNEVLAKKIFEKAKISNANKLLGRYITLEKYRIYKNGLIGKKFVSRKEVHIK